MFGGLHISGLAYHMAKITRTELQWLHDKILSVTGSLYLCKLEAVKFEAPDSLGDEIDKNISNLKALLDSIAEDKTRTMRQLTTDFRQREMRSQMTKYEGR